MNERRNMLRRYVVIGLGLLVYMLLYTKKTFRWGEIRPELRRLLIVGGSVFGFVSFMFLYYHFEVWAIKNPKRFWREVGYRLPEDARILYTEAHIFSLADGSNYLWLITSKSSLIPWAERAGWRIGPSPGSWNHVTSFYEIAPYEEGFKQLALDSIWRVLAHSPRGRDETSYIFIAGNQQVALIKTFRP